MNNTKVEHTPGPWRSRAWRNGRRDSGLCVETEDGHDIAEVTGGDRANARLIAAAPALLEALQAWVSERGWVSLPDPDLFEIEPATHRAWVLTRRALAQAGKGDA